MRAAFPKANACIEGRFYGRDLPVLAMDPAERNNILINSRPEEYPPSCAATSAQGRRLCACVGATTEAPSGAAARPDLVHRRVSAALARTVAEAARKEKAQGPPAATPELGKETWLQAFPARKMVGELHRGLAVFARGRLGQTCLDACTELGYGCAPRWFDHLNNCDAVLAAFPEAHACRSDVFGVDLPAFRPSTGDAMVNAKPEQYRARCTSHDPQTKRLCGCGFLDGGPAASRTYHTVYSVQASQYFEWQVRFMHLWFKQAAVPGKLTRLLSAGGPDFLVETIPTHVAPPVPVPADPGYQPYNKPAAIMHWLSNDRPTEDIVVIIDPDCMYVSPLEIIVDEGAPVAQRAFYSFEHLHDVPMQIARKYCNGCTFVDPIAVPVIIHRRDLAKIAPLWLEKTAQIRADRGTWPPNWDNKTLSPVGLGWTAEMFGYVFAAAELGIRHECFDLQNVPTVHREINTHILHFHVDVPLPNGKRWYKHDDDAGYNIPWPVPDGTDEVSATIVRKVYEAYQLLGPSNHTWHTPNKYTPEV